MDEEQHDGPGALSRGGFEQAFKAARRLEESVGRVVVGHGPVVRRVLGCLVSGVDLGACVGRLVGCLGGVPGWMPGWGASVGCLVLGVGLGHKVLTF